MKPGACHDSGTTATEERPRSVAASKLQLSLIFKPRPNILLNPIWGLTLLFTSLAYLASSVKSTFAGVPSLTSISWVALPAFRWAALSVYLPAGTLLILKVPSLAETAKYG